MKAKTTTGSNQPRKGTKTGRRNRPLTMALLAGLVLTGVTVYLLKTSLAGRDRGKLADGTGLSGNGTANDSATGMSSRGSSNANDASVDFSGIKSTLDPDVAEANSAITHPTPKPQPAPIPLVFQKVDPERLAISPDQQEVIDWLQQNFVDMIGGTNQDPSDPNTCSAGNRLCRLSTRSWKCSSGKSFTSNMRLRRHRRRPLEEMEADNRIDRTEASSKFRVPGSGFRVPGWATSVTRREYTQEAHFSEVSGPCIKRGKCRRNSELRNLKFEL